MHQIIRIICYAENGIEARERAEDILNEGLIGEGKPFDYGTFFDEDGGGVSGSGRWGNLPVVSLADSKEGKKLIKEGMKYTKESFMENLKPVRKMINFYSDEELFEEKVVDVRTKILESLKDEKDRDLVIRMFKHYCNCVGEYTGTGIYLYDNDGEGIRSNKHLKDVLDKWEKIYGGENKSGEKNPYKDLKVFVIPIDVHS